jgi:hypothetical protein
VTLKVIKITEKMWKTNKLGPSQQQCGYPEGKKEL